jgi:uncharacterized protein (DUF488 family)
MPKTDQTVLTIGHSTREFGELLALLQANDVRNLVDVRSFPRSRRNPQFNRETLGGTLESAGIGYSHAKVLGGLRKTRKDSPNTAWRNASFRGYADYMLTDEFADGLQWLLEVSARQRVAIMCAEAVPWRCHRSMIADALVVNDRRVEHIMSGQRNRPHSLKDFAVVKGDRIFYPAERTAELFD